MEVPIICYLLTDGLLLSARREWNYSIQISLSSFLPKFSHAKTWDVKCVISAHNPNIPIPTLLNIIDSVKYPLGDMSAAGRTVEMRELLLDGWRTKHCRLGSRYGHLKRNNIKTGRRTRWEVGALVIVLIKGWSTAAKLSETPSASASTSTSAATLGMLSSRLHPKRCSYLFPWKSSASPGRVYRLVHVSFPLAGSIPHLRFHLNWVHESKGTPDCGNFWILGRVYSRICRLLIIILIGRFATGPLKNVANSQEFIFTFIRCIIICTGFHENIYLLVLKKCLYGLKKSESEFKCNNAFRRKHKELNVYWNTKNKRKLVEMRDWEGRRDSV